MKAFQWNACFITGLHDVDEQHHRLVDLINRFGELIMDRDGATDASLDSVFLELADYSRYHFDDEEALMVAERLDPRDVAEHKRIHAGFLSEVIRLHRAASKDIEASRYLLQFLTHWLAYHILGTDQIMVRKIAAIRGGCDPKDVCGNLRSSQDPATDTLLAALNALFNQVSERNHQLEKLNASLEARVADRTRALTEANQRLDELANTDPLTGLHNRRYAMQRLATEWESSETKGTPLSCLMIDADGFKQINDRFGHDAGDIILRALARQLLLAVRTDDIVCRLGGDEFLIICTRTPFDGALQLAETVRAEVAALRVPVGDGKWIGSISVGVASRSCEMTGYEALIKAADLGVYAAKRGGRNCVATSQ